MHVEKKVLMASSYLLLKVLINLIPSGLFSISNFTCYPSLSIHLILSIAFFLL